MKVSVVIPNWNGEHLIEKNFSSWVSVGADEIIIVDDGSQDNSKLKIQNLKLQFKIKNLKLIENKKNLGFARSVNRGVEKARGDIVILLNTDVRPKPGLIDAILSHFKDKKVFGVSFGEQKFSWAKGRWVNGFFEHEPGPRTKTVHSTFWVSGGSGAFRKSIWGKLGGLDPLYAPFYWEDIDLCYRAAKRGYKLLWEPNAQVIHEHEGTIGKYFSQTHIDFIQERNQLLFIWKNITSSKMFREHLGKLVRRIGKNPGYIKVVIAATTYLPQIISKRRREKKESYLTDEQIFARFQ